MKQSPISEEEEKKFRDSLFSLIISIYFLVSVSPLSFFVFLRVTTSDWGWRVWCDSISPASFELGCANNRHTRNCVQLPEWLTFLVSNRANIRCKNASFSRNNLKMTKRIISQAKCLGSFALFFFFFFDFTRLLAFMLVEQTSAHVAGGASHQAADLLSVIAVPTPCYYYMWLFECDAYGHHSAKWMETIEKAKKKKKKNSP